MLAMLAMLAMIAMLAIHHIFCYFFFIKFKFYFSSVAILLFCFLVLTIVQPVAYWFVNLELYKLPLFYSYLNGTFFQYQMQN